MNPELKQIKKLYGEKFSHLCRTLFATILEKNGMLFEILNETFSPNHFLYDDLLENNLINEFKDYIYTIYYTKLDIINSPKVKIEETPEQLMEKAGYILKECLTEEEIQTYKKYYAPNEELCTFRNKRLNDCRVFFAVKKNVLDIKREDFINPKRQDEYGTSVISIQFSKNGCNTLSIKNRYNHTVSNPDATFSNNLDNIIAGLTESFENTYGIIQKNKYDDFEIKDYVRANDGKLYKYNYEINNKYYCPNNIIIDNFEVKHFDKEKYIILDYFVLDLVNKKIYLYDQRIKDCFTKSFEKINKINIFKEGNNKRIIITPLNGSDIEILINNCNQIIEFKNDNIKKLGNRFLIYDRYLKSITLSNVQKVGHEFIAENKVLENIECSNLEEIADYFLYYNKCLKKIDLPNVRIIGNSFLYSNQILEKMYCPNLKRVGSYFLISNVALNEFVAQNLQKVGNSFLEHNQNLKVLNLICLQYVGNNFLFYNQIIEEFDSPNLKVVGDQFLRCNQKLKVLKFPSLTKAGHFFLYSNSILEIFESPNLYSVGTGFLSFNQKLKVLELPYLRRIGSSFLYRNQVLEIIYCPKVEQYLNGFTNNHIYNFVQKNKQKVLKR